MINNLKRETNLADQNKQFIFNLTSLVDQNNFDAKDMEEAYLAAIGGKEG